MIAITCGVDPDELNQPQTVLPDHRYRTQVLKIVIAIDTSASVDDEMISSIINPVDMFSRA